MGKSMVFRFDETKEPLITFEDDSKPSDWIEALKIYNPFLDTDVLVYRSPEKLAWLKEQEKKYGKMGEI